MLKKCTIVDIAREAGTSTATVSRVLSRSNYPVSPELKEKVIETAKKMNYHPNLIGQMLQSGEKPREIGIILPSIVNPFYASLMSAIEIECKKRAYVSILCISQNSHEAEMRHFDTMVNHQVAGILMSCMDMDEKFKKKIEASHIPCILFDQTYENYDGLSVGFDFFKGGYLATEYLIRCAHRDIAFASGRLDRISRQQRLEGYKAALKDNRIRFSPKRCYIYNQSSGDYNDGVKDGYELGKMILESKYLPDAIFAINDMTAIGIIQYLKKQGVYVPADISVIGFDNIMISGFVEPKLTTISQPAEEMGKQAAIMLLDIINGGISNQKNIMMEPTLIERASVRKRLKYLKK